MNLLTIYPIQSCNYNCSYCPTKQWLYPVDHKYNRLNNDLIFTWLDKHCPPEEWCIEISGGEPGVYGEIEGLVNGLTERGYYGLIKTNGSLPIPQSDNFRRIAAWHQCKGIDEPPKYYDTILIIKNPNDCWEDKMQYCIEQKIPYRDVPFRDTEVRVGPSAEEDPNNEFFKYWTILYSGGQLSMCYGGENNPEITVQNMSSPPKVKIEGSCARCYNVKGVEIFLPDELIKKLKKRRREFKKKTLNS